MTMQGGSQISEDQIPVSSGSLSGETAGSVSYSETNLGGIKITMVYFNGYENDTTTNQDITFPIAYGNTPEIVVGNSTLPALSAIGLLFQPLFYLCKSPIIRGAPCIWKPCRIFSGIIPYCRAYNIHENCL